MGGANVQNMIKPVQREITSANNCDNACAITITAGQQSFQVNGVYFLRNSQCLVIGYSHI